MSNGEVNWAHALPFDILRFLFGILGFVGILARRPEGEQFFRLTKTAKQATLVLSSMEPDAARRKKGRSKPDRVLRQAPRPAVMRGQASLSVGNLLP